MGYSRTLTMIQDVIFALHQWRATLHHASHYLQLKAILIQLHICAALRQHRDYIHFCQARCLTTMHHASLMNLLIQQAWPDHIRSFLAALAFNSSRHCCCCLQPGELPQPMC
jgi:hypothetical protein